MSHVKITIPITIKPSRHLQKRRGDLVDPWELRDAFLSWPLENWRAFGTMDDLWTGSPVTEQQFADWQRLLRRALVVPAQDWKRLSTEFGKLAAWLSIELSIEFDWSGSVPTARIIVNSELQAMLEATRLDKLLGAEFRVCSRSDCQNPPFRVEARQKEYCSYDCAHLMAVRRSRERAADFKRTTSTKSGKAKRRA
jgi:hypothetical protein